jgi:hypothetical protein
MARVAVFHLLLSRKDWRKGNGREGGRQGRKETKTNY